MARFRRKPLEVEAITFDELVAYGIERCKAEGREDNIINGMPWSFDYRGRRITHENGNCYIVGSLVMGRDDVLFTKPDGSLFRVLRSIEFLADFEPAAHGGPSNAPERLWLQVDQESPDVDDCTWCRDKINDADVLYVRADVAGVAIPLNDQPKEPK